MCRVDEELSKYRLPAGGLVAVHLEAVRVRVRVRARVWVRFGDF